jgi:hypothetical protein
MTDETESAPRWLWWVAAGIVLVILAALIVLTHLLHWFWPSNLWFNYGWSSDKGNGPEALQQTIVYAALALILIPPVRKFLQHEFHKVHAKIEAVHETVKEHHEEAKADREATHKMLHHVIASSPKIDNHVPGLDEKYQPPINPPTKPPTA